MEHHSVCTQTNLSPYLGVLNSDRVVELLRHNFYNVTVMEIVRCIVEDITFMRESDENFLFKNQRIKIWLNHLKLLSDESTFGLVFTVGLKNTDNAFVIKTPKIKGNQELNLETESLMHEFMVGTYALNPLRTNIPNFSYVLGKFHCSTPYVGKMKETFWCSSRDNQQLTYVIYENIFPSITAGEYVRTCTITQFLNLYSQILYALELAHRTSDFTHYDLHPENVLMREIDQPSLIFHELDGETIYIKVDSVATIIDYGYSHYVKDGIHHGLSAEFSGISSSTSYPMHDAYRFLLSCLYEMHNFGNDILDDLVNLIEFFYPEEENYMDFVLDIESVSDIYIGLDDKDMRDMRHVDLIDWMYDIYNEEINEFIMIEPDGSPILSTSHPNSDFMNLETVYSELGLDLSPTANSILEIYDIHSRNPSEDVQKYKSSYQNDRIRFIEKMQKSQNTLIRLMNKVNKPSNLDEVYQYMYKVVSIYDIYNSSLDALSMGEVVSDLFKDQNVSRQIKAMRNRLVNLDISTILDKVDENIPDFDYEPQSDIFKDLSPNVDLMDFISTRRAFLTLIKG